MLCCPHDRTYWEEMSFACACGRSWAEWWCEQSPGWEIWSWASLEDAWAHNSVQCCLDRDTSKERRVGIQQLLKLHPNHNFFFTALFIYLFIFLPNYEQNAIGGKNINVLLLKLPVGSPSEWEENQSNIKAIKNKCQLISSLFTFFTVSGGALSPRFRRKTNSSSENALGGEHVCLCMGNGTQRAASLELTGIITGHELKKDLSGSKI